MLRCHKLQNSKLILSFRFAGEDSNQSDQADAHRPENRFTDDPLGLNEPDPRSLGLYFVAEGGGLASRQYHKEIVLL